MSKVNIAYINAPSVAVLTTATALPFACNFVLLTNTTDAAIYVETGTASVTATSAKACVGAGQTQVYRNDILATHIIASAVGIVAQAVEGV